MAPSTAEAESGSRVALAVFFGLVAVTAAAFVVTQRLKRPTPVVRHISTQLYVSPNGDGRKDRAKITFRLPKADRVTVSITDSGDDEVRRLADRHLSRGRHKLFWNGRDGSGRIPPDGLYYVRFILRDQARGTTTRRGIQLVTVPPRPRILAVSPGRAGPGAGSVVTVRYTGPSSPPARYSVYRTDTGTPQLVDRFTGARSEHSAVWDKRLEDGRRAPPGTYAFGVTVQNRARVAGSFPRRLPPRRQTAAPGTGVTIAGPAAAPPLEPVAAGSAARIDLSGASGRVRWSIVPLGSHRPLRRGTGRAPVVRARVPADARTGLYTVRLTARRGTAVAPLAVRGRRGGRVLVVLPAIGWQGLNPVDGDADGFPDTLDDSRSIALDRPFAGGRLPAGLRAEVAPLLRFLAARKLRYDLTTDLALARGHGPRLRGRPAVVFAGTERWFTESLDRDLRDYVEGGGKVASFGTDAFRRTVAVTPTSLVDPSAPLATNALGEQTDEVESAAAPLVLSSDELGLFSGTDGYVGLFTRFEQSQGLVSGARRLTGAGRDPDHPAFVAYRLGRGTVVRAGTPQWAANLSSDAEVANVTASLWSFLSR